jgi:hypothetical protein
LISAYFNRHEKLVFLKNSEPRSRRCILREAGKAGEALGEEAEEKR